MSSPTKNLKLKTDFFFIAHLKTSRVLCGLNSSLAQLTGKLWSCKVVWK